MVGINFIGSYSGIDQTTIDKLMQAEKMPLVQLSNKKASITDKQNAWKDINTRLNSLFEKIKTLQNGETYTGKASSSTNDKIITMNASKNAASGSYKVNVKQLATNTSIISSKITAAYDENGKLDVNKSLGLTDGDNFSITNADNENAVIQVDSNDSLKSIISKINEKTKDITIEGVTTKGTGISATIIDGRIVLADEKQGERTIVLGGSAIAGLGLDVAPKLGQDALFTVNGVEIKRTTNTISDAIDGVTINLHKEHIDGETDTVNISLNTEKTSKAIQDFVDQYNSTMKFIEDKLAAGDPKIPGSKGALAGDSSLMRLHSSLRNMVTSSLVNENTNIKDISQLGVSTIDRFGQLKFDTAKLTQALKEDPNSVMNFFSSKNDLGDEIGFVPRIKTYIDSFISSNKGIIKGKNESFERTIKDLNKQIDTFNARMEKKEAYYIKMFSALDVAMMQSENQMSWLQGQVDAMNSVKRK